MKPNHSCQSVFLAGLTIALWLMTPTQTPAAPGDLDPVFARSGLTRTDFSKTDEYGFAVKIQPDGKIVVGGQSGTYPVFHAALVRYNANGKLDQTFGSGGRVTTALDAGGDGVAAIVLQTDGKIVTAGSIIHDNSTLGFVVGRFNSNGSLDSTFGSNGSVETTFGDPAAEGNDVVLQTDGKIVVVGFTGAGSYSALNDFALARYNSDGTLDQSFGQGGKLTTHFPGNTNTGSVANCAILQADGKLIVAGTYVNEGTPNTFALARYNPDGSLDSSFGNAGLVTTKIGAGAALAFGIILQPDGRIVLSGYSATTEDEDFTLACYQTNGTLDSTFGNGGVTTTNFSSGSSDIAYAIAVQRDGKIVTAGKTGDYPLEDFALTRYTSTGQLDQTFGAGGIVTTDISPIDLGYALTIQRDGRIVLAGAVIGRGGTFDVGVARYLGR